MRLEKAIEIVMELARQNVLDEKECTNNKVLRNERKKQLDAIGTVEDHFVNTVWG